MCLFYIDTTRLEHVLFQTTKYMAVLPHCRIQSRAEGKRKKNRTRSADLCSSSAKIAHLQEHVIAGFFLQGILARRQRSNVPYTVACGSRCCRCCAAVHGYIGCFVATDSAVTSPRGQHVMLLWPATQRGRILRLALFCFCNYETRRRTKGT